MEVDDIFSELAQHMVEGMMFHEQLMNVYYYLGLKGYSKMHEYHYLKETKEYIELQKYYQDTYGHIVRPSAPDNPGIIPESWYDILRESVTADARKKAVASGVHQWEAWETMTVQLYQKSCKDLMTNAELVPAEFVKTCMMDAETERKYAKQERILKESVGFDMVSILEEQDKYEHTYKKLIRKDV